MLQIISGRFFGDGQLQAMESDAILYSNLCWIAPIRAQVADLRPVDNRSRSVSAYVVRYTNRYEQQEGDCKALPQAEEAVDQFRLLCSFWFKAFFHADRNHVELLCRGDHRHGQDTILPRHFVPRFFDPGITTSQPEVVGFTGFVARVLAMPRQKYKLLMSCLGTFFDALEALSTNFDLAYSMMVYVLEAMCQSEDGYTPTWEDYDQNVRGRLEVQFIKIDTDIAEAIRRALLDCAHLKLMKRFTGFVALNVTDAFFTTQAEGLTHALSKSRLERALKNLYASRSGFVHRLRKVREQLSHPLLAQNSDMFEWENEPYLTFSGLVRLTHHVLSTFISRQPIQEQEDYPAWRNELPGTMQFEMAPQYWICQAEGFSPSYAKRRFSGFVKYLAGVLAGAEKAVPDMTAMMVKIEEIASSCSQADRVPMLALYWLYHVIVRPDHRRPNWEAFLSRFDSELEECSIELLAFWPILTCDPLRWPTQDCVAVFEEYQERRYKASAVHLPAVIEMAIMAGIANLYLKAGDIASFALWADRAILDAAGRKSIQETLAPCKADSRPIDTRQLIGLPQASQPADDTSDSQPPDEAQVANAETATPAGPAPLE